MPTILIIFGFKFYFYSLEHSPIHVHVDKGDAWAKIELEPEIKVIENHGLKAQEIKKAIGLVKLYKEDFIEAWHKYFNE